MNLYIDCEFNGKGGELISMALVAEDGREFYEVVQIPSNCTPWVFQNVIPILGKKPIGPKAFQAKLRHFLDKYPHPTIIADWPIDIAYFCEWVIVGDYPMCDAPMFKAECMSLPYCPESKVPHNALEDARAIAKAVRALTNHPK